MNKKILLTLAGILTAVVLIWALTVFSVYMENPFEVARNAVAEETQVSLDSVRFLSGSTRILPLICLTTAQVELPVDGDKGQAEIEILSIPLIGYSVRHFQLSRT